MKKPTHDTYADLKTLPIIHLGSNSLSGLIYVYMVLTQLFCYHDHDFAKVINFHFSDMLSNRILSIGCLDI